MFGPSVVTATAKFIWFGTTYPAAASGVARFKWPERLELTAELPVTKVGKLDKKALRDLLA